MLYKIKNKNGEFFVKILSGKHQLDGNNNCLKISEWSATKGTIFDSKESLNRALNGLTKVSKPTKIRPYPYLPTYKMEDLEIVEIED